MKITVTSVLVDDQAKALRFYTDVLGFVKKTEIEWMPNTSACDRTASPSLSHRPTWAR
jgi:catechol 2,3-dioxygenase-like lactoylglutathione lyase family enzyme